MKDIVLFGRGERASAVSESLFLAGHKISWWYSVPEHGRDWEAALRDLGRDLQLGIVANWPLKLRPEVLSLPKHGFINCHAGPVPNYRGGSPLNWQIINGEERLWVSLLKMDEGLDTGPVLSSTSFKLENHETIADAHRKANVAFAEMVVAHVWLLENAPESITETPQEFFSDIRETKTWPQRNDAMGEIDLSWPAERIVNFVRALTRPYPGAWIQLGAGTEKLRVWDASWEPWP